MEFFIISMLNGLSYGLLLFMLSSGLTLIFSMMGVLNFAHASFYMLGAYVGYTLSRFVGFWPALLIAPLVVGALGAVFERQCLRRVHKFGHVPELLITFGLSYVIVELVQLIWGRIAVEFRPPEMLQGPAFTLINNSLKGLSLVWGAAPAELCRAADTAVRIVCSPFPATRGFMMLVAVIMLASVWLLLTRTRIGLVIQAALTHPEAVESLGHNVPRVFMLVFGAGSALAGLAGVIGGSTFLTELTAVEDDHRARGGAPERRVPDRPVVPGERRYRDGDRVRHARWGDGIVVSSKLTRSDEEVTIAFRDPQIGRKTLLASLAGLELTG